MFVLLMLIAYTISTFVIYPLINFENNPQNTNRKLAYCFISLIISLFLAIDNNQKTIIIILEICIIQVIIEFIGHSLVKHISNKYKPNKLKSNYSHTLIIILFLSKQLIQFGIIIGFNHLVFDYSPFNNIIGFFILNSNPIITLEVKKIFILLYITLSGSQLIPLIFNLIYSNIEDYNNKLTKIAKKEMGLQDGIGIIAVILNKDEHGFISEISIGKWIGILERMLFLIFLYMNQISGLIFTISIKTLARFKMMENKIFSEYYLLGTLLSVGYTLVGFFILNRLF